MRQITFILAGALLAITGTANAQMDPERAERVVDTRQSLLTVMVWNFGPMGAMARDRIEFDVERVQKNSVRVAALARMMSDAFTADTRGSGVATDALDGIWENPDDFASKVDALIEASDKLVSVASSGDEGDMREAIANVGSTCGSCHDSYKAD